MLFRNFTANVYSIRAKLRGLFINAVLIRLQIIGLLSLTTLTLSAETTYIYQEDDGTRWITDHRMPVSRYTLLNKYGRPTATQSCQNLTELNLIRRAKRYIMLIQTYAQKNKLDPLLVKAVIRVESCFDRRAVSRAGAEGLMQLMPATAQELGVLDSFNPELNIAAGTYYLSQLQKIFKGDLKLVLAAYNAGPNNVRKYQGIPPFKETQSYVKRVMHHYQLYQSK